VLQVPPGATTSGLHPSPRELPWYVRIGGEDHGHGSTADVSDSDEDGTPPVSRSSVTFREVRCVEACAGPDPVRLVAATAPEGHHLSLDDSTEDSSAPSGRDSAKKPCCTFVLVMPEAKQAPKRKRAR